MEGQGDLVTRLIMGIIGVTIWVIGVINLLTKSPPDPPSSNYLRVLRRLKEQNSMDNREEKGSCHDAIQVLGF